MTLTSKDDIIILGHTIKLGENKTIDFSIAKLYSASNVEIPIIIEHSIVHQGEAIFHISTDYASNSNPS